MTSAIIAIYVLSHERPLSLDKQLSSMRSLIKSDRVHVYVCDNSTIKSSEIKLVLERYSLSGVILKPGGSQADNFRSVIKNLKTPFFAIFHDDDFVYFTLSGIQELTQVLSRSHSNNKLHLFKSYGLSEDFSYFSIPNTPIIRPYSVRSVPYCLPFFPAWIFPNHQAVLSELSNAIDKKGIYQDYGKYSDIVFIERLLEHYRYQYSEVPGLYFHVQHHLNDGRHLDILAKLNLLIHIGSKLIASGSARLIIQFSISLLHSSVDYLIKRMQSNFR